MTKISEKILWDDMAGKMTVQETHDFTPALEKAKTLKSLGLNNFGNDNKLVGVVPAKMFQMWAKKWGVSMSDSKAMEEVVAKEMMDPDNSQLRVWEGTF
jgi:hypothetical protein|tara:strand:- start:163 stop:459 length:297 start_codon:yes stop_codon:yes gene_type:complete